MFTDLGNLDFRVVALDDEIHTDYDESIFLYRRNSISKLVQQFDDYIFRFSLMFTASLIGYIFVGICDFIRVLDIDNTFYYCTMFSLIVYFVKRHLFFKATKDMNTMVIVNSTMLESFILKIKWCYYILSGLFLIFMIGALNAFINNL